MYLGDANVMQRVLRYGYCLFLSVIHVHAFSSVNLLRHVRSRSATQVAVSTIVVTAGSLTSCMFHFVTVKHTHDALTHTDRQSQTDRDT